MVHDNTAALPSFSSTYWGFIFAAYIRKGDEGYVQIERCGEVPEDSPPLPPPTELLLLLLSSGVSTGLADIWNSNGLICYAVQWLNLVCNWVTGFIGVTINL